MSNQRISGEPSGQWHNYSELLSSQTGNDSAPASSRRAHAGQFEGLPSARLTVAHPPTLQPGMVSSSSVEGLQPYFNSSNPDERALAAALTSAIQNGSLTLGNPAAQNATRAQYGQRLQTTHGNAVIVANFRLRGDGRFDLVMAVMRDPNDSSRRVTIAAHQEASISAQAQSNSAPLPRRNPPLAPQLPVQHPGNPVAGPSSQPAQPQTTAPVFSTQISRGIRQIVNDLPRWEQSTLRTQIESKLSSMSTDDQRTVLMHLNSQLSGRASTAKPAIIQRWAEMTTVNRAMEGRDLRTDRQRELQDALATQNKNPAFREARDAILAMVPSGIKQRMGRIGITQYGKYHSTLYRRAFADSRGPVAALNDIRALIEPLHELQRYNAIKNWIPK
ncbi:hypothetical protein [Burkholderia metallica]|uniref:hypothetical protein n=1 Tax=Burkholderia metallica TaxID=488729 RepID=UPI001CF2D127|nr:hypothetical protein [Burkholderia metallica]MCA8003489.1 hypothetical protein [Burkholderia metallica]